MQARPEHEPLVMSKHAIALFSDSHMLPGLHVTILSLLDALRANEGAGLDLHVFFDRVRPAEQQRLQRTHASHARGTSLTLHEFSPISPRGANSLHGNQTAYGRLYLSDLLPDYDRCVYLDSDLFVNRSVADLFELFDDEAVLLVNGVDDREWSLDRELFEKANLDMSKPCFNSGVMGMNLKLWRELMVSELCEQTALAYRGMFRSADQALLNVALHDSFKAVGRMWNLPLNPATRHPDELGEAIYHLVGSPKPWDIFGRFLSNHYKMWHSCYRRTALSGRLVLRYSSLARCVRISRQGWAAWCKIRAQANQPVNP
jgi:lipopolysaccharide biosynthesis glycosyltransferase